MLSLRRGVRRVGGVFGIAVRDPPIADPQTPGCQRVEAVEAACDEGGLRSALDLNSLVDGELETAGNLRDLGNDGIHAYARADLHGGDEAHLVEAVVHLRGDALEVEQLGPELRRERQREEAVGDRTAEGALGGGALGVDVDPLVIVDGVGEEVHPILGDLEPLGETEVGSGQGGRVGVGGDGGHECSLVRGVGGVPPPSTGSGGGGDQVKAETPVSARPTMSEVISWVPS
jgi:hypothetical protein